MKQQTFFTLTVCAAFLAAVFLFFPLLGAYYLALSACTFALYGIDKQHAIQGKRRIPEYRLHLSALFGGWCGAYLGSRTFRHKTTKKRFALLFRLTAVANIAATCILIDYLVPSDFFKKLGQHF